MKKIYVFGHRNPDTDSVSSAITLSYLRRELGCNTIPVILSNINNETRFALKYFNIPEPKFLNDVKTKIKDTKYKKNLIINENNSLIEAYSIMINRNSSKVPVVDDNKHFKGIIAMKDIAKYLIENNNGILNTTYESIKNAVDGKEILKFDSIINGNSLTASYKSETFIENINLDNTSILIVGDRHRIIEHAINNNIKLLILTGNTKIKQEHLELAIKNKINVIRTPFNTFQTVQMVQLSNTITSLPIDTSIFCVNDTDSLDEFIKMANKTKFTYYPVIGKNNKCLGIINLSDTYEKNRQQVILVDHNSKNQTIEGIDDADIIEIVDHHNIGNLGTNMPISFRNMPVGSTNTIIYQMFIENNITIPSSIAGIMASGIISDTLLLKSPTTTKLDEIALIELSKIAKIDYNTFGLELLKAGAAITGKTREELLYQDFKTYPLPNNKFLAIGQISTTDPSIFLNEKEEYVKLLNSFCDKNNYYILTFFISDVLSEGSYIFYNNDAKEILEKAFNRENLQEGDFLEKIISRKLQVVPNIMGQF